MKDGKILAISPLPEENDELDSKLKYYRIVQFTGKIQSVEKPMDIFLLNALEIDRDLNFIQKKKIPIVIIMDLVIYLLVMIYSLKMVQ